MAKTIGHILREADGRWARQTPDGQGKREYGIVAGELLFVNSILSPIRMILN